MAAALVELLLLLRRRRRRATAALEPCRCKRLSSASLTSNWSSSLHRLRSPSSRPDSAPKGSLQEWTIFYSTPSVFICVFVMDSSGKDQVVSPTMATSTTDKSPTPFSIEDILSKPSSSSGISHPYGHHPYSWMYLNPSWPILAAAATAASSSPSAGGNCSPDDEDDEDRHHADDNNLGGSSDEDDEYDDDVSSMLSSMASNDEDHHHHHHPDERAIDMSRSQQSSSSSSSRREYLTIPKAAAYQPETGSRAQVDDMMLLLQIYIYTRTHERVRHGSL